MLFCDLKSPPTLLSNIFHNFSFCSCILFDYSGYSGYAGKFCADVKCGQFARYAARDSSVPEKRRKGMEKLKRKTVSHGTIRVVQSGQGRFSGENQKILKKTPYKRLAGT